MPLGQWIADNRRTYARGDMDADRVDQLEKLGMVWSHFDVAWEEGLAAARGWAVEHGHLQAPLDATYQGCRVGVWLKNQRAVQGDVHRGHWDARREAALGDRGAVDADGTDPRLQLRGPQFQSGPGPRQVPPFGPPQVSCAAAEHLEGVVLRRALVVASAFPLRTPPGRGGAGGAPADCGQVGRQVQPSRAAMSSAVALSVRRCRWGRGGRRGPAVRDR
ncbi:MULTISPECIES: helicase associated domain-containing protein [Streptomyces]|uniref:helicase associated domain-containing protein n=1 Tax=Streptomyces TaxID=1883 RepID=UPI0035DCA56D